MTRAMLLGELLPELEGLSADLAITGLVQDSREVKPGDAFVAIAGFGAHGLNFVDVAREAGWFDDLVEEVIDLIFVVAAEAALEFFVVDIEWCKQNQDLPSI